MHTDPMISVKYYQYSKIKEMVLSETENLLTAFYARYRELQTAYMHEIMTQLQNQQAVYCRSYYHILTLAIFQDDVKIFEFFLDMKNTNSLSLPDVADYCQMLQMAIRYRRLTMLRCLIIRHEKFSGDVAKFLHESVVTGKIDTIKSLLLMNVINSENICQTISIASRTTHTTVQNFLLKFYRFQRDTKPNTSSQSSASDKSCQKYTDTLMRKLIFVINN